MISATSGEEVLRIERLTKTFDGKTNAVDGVSFAVVQGEIFGFLGPNGAGKSTTINMLTTILRPTSGNAVVCGNDLTKAQNAVRRSIGVGASGIHGGRGPYRNRERAPLCGLLWDT